MTRVVIYGGNGFVGSHIAQCLHGKDAQVSCVSRSGKMPEHLVGELWASKVDWLRGNAGEPDKDLLRQSDVVVTAVGAPPLPTLTKAAYQRSLQTNGLVNQQLLHAAGESDVSRAVVIGAKVPAFLDKTWFAYATGKRVTLDAAHAFSQLSKAHSAVVIQPGGIYGTRHTAGGRPIPLGAVLSPLAKLLPSQLVAVERVAACAAAAALGEIAIDNRFSVISNSQI